MGFLRISLSLLMLVSCAKTSYLLEQGAGQIGLEWSGRDNKKVLGDPKVSSKDKRKIKLIEKAKKYFYQYFELKETDIYDETTFLKENAVTYLLIASPRDQIKAREFKFPIMGSFPYLGFFSEKSAKKYAANLQKENEHTYIRPVYAYSTLNQWIFDDNILSSFFFYKDEDLVELIFHELVHTVVFLKNDIEFNENLAQFISKELVQEYFNYSQDKKEKLTSEQMKNNSLSSFIASKAKKLNVLYQTNQNAEIILRNFLEKEFTPEVRALCLKLKIINCYPLSGEWNNARFAAFMTYEARQNELESIYLKNKMPLKSFFHRIIKATSSFDGSGKEDFLTFLSQKDI